MGTVGLGSEILTDFLGGLRRCLLKFSNRCIVQQANQKMTADLPTNVPVSNRMAQWCSICCSHFAQHQNRKPVSYEFVRAHWAVGDQNKAVVSVSAMTYQTDT